MTPRELAEYRALRATIRERSSAGVWILVVGITGWAGLVTATAALAALPVATLLPLLVLAAVFEAVLALHVGVERIGRYLQVFCERETEAAANWEQTAMAFGRLRVRGAPDALFTPIFLCATLLNFVPVLFAEPVRIEVVVVGSVHLFFAARVLIARARSGHQRARDLESFQAIKNELANPQK